MEAFSSVLDGKEVRLAQVLAGFVLALWVLVPIHEVFHVLGCVLSGGQVTRLEISPLFGGALFARFVPWIVSGGDNAGRLSGFVPAGDLSYLSTVLAPHVILCPLGSAVARMAVRRRRAWLFGAALAGALQPLASITGDAYEAASIPITRLADLGGWHWALQLRGDDVIAIAHEAARVGTPVAWVLFAAGCLGGAVGSAILLIACGGIAPAVRPD